MKSKRPTGQAEILKFEQDPSRKGMFVEDVEITSDGSKRKPFDGNTLLLLLKVNTYHSRCINIKARMTCGLGYELQPKGDAGKNSVKSDIKLFSEFEQQHAMRAGEPLSETLVNFQKDFEIFGNGFLEVGRTNEGTVAEIFHMRSRECTVTTKKAKDNSEVLMLEQGIGQKKAKFKAFGAKEPKGLNEFIHLKDYWPESRYYGYPEYLTALATMLLDRGAVTYNAKRFSNDLMLDTILFLSGWKLDDTGKKATRDFFKREYKGLDALSSFLLMTSDDKEGKLQVEKINAEVKEAGFRLMRTDNREEVVDAHGVPRRIVGLAAAGKLGDSTQTREEMKIFRDIAIWPRQQKMEFIFNMFILPGMGINNVEFKLKQIDLSDDVADAEYYQTLVTSGIIDADEARVPLGFGERVKKSFGGETPQRGEKP